jgi:hypothetical protein
MNRHAPLFLFSSLVLAFLTAGCFQELDSGAASGGGEDAVDAAPALETPEIELPDGTTTTDACAAVTVSATDILTTNCAKCHGGGAAKQGGFDFVLDVNSLKTARSAMLPDPLDAPLGWRFLRPGDPWNSRMWRRIWELQMPPADIVGLPPNPDRPSFSDASLIYTWIQSCVTE